jgi:hypothetical protein
MSMIYLTKDNYHHNLRHDIRSGDLLAWKGTSWVGRFIRHWTGSDFSHVGIAWVFADRVFVLEAREFRGVQITPLSSALPCYWISTGIKWTPALEEAALDEVGQRYSFADAIRAGVGLKPRSANGWQCAEYAAWLLYLARLPDLTRQEADFTFCPTPGELVDNVLITTGR